MPIYYAVQQSAILNNWLPTGKLIAGMSKMRKAMGKLWNTAAESNPNLNSNPIHIYIPQLTTSHLTLPFYHSPDDQYKSHRHSGHIVHTGREQHCQR